MNNLRNLRMERIRPFTIVLLMIVGSLVIAGWAVYRGHDVEAESRQQAVVSTDFINDVRLLEAALLDAETGQRGFLLTGQDVYLQTYESGLENFAATLKQVKSRAESLTDNKHTELLLKLEELGTQKLAELAETIRLFTIGNNDEALELVSSNLGKRLMDQFRSIVEQLKEEERLILDRALIRAKAIQSATARLLVFLLVMVSLLLAMTAYLFFRSEKLNRTEELLSLVSVQRDSNDLLAKELSHRIRNLFSMVISIVRMTSREKMDAATLVNTIVNRLMGLSRAQSLTIAGQEQQQVELGDLVKTMLEPHSGQKSIYSVEGPTLYLMDHLVTTLGLILNELATNAVKYGNWSTEDGGTIRVSWTCESKDADQAEEKIVVLHWVERELRSPSAPEDLTKINPTTPEGSGFGSKMMEMSARQLNGTLKKSWQGGLLVELAFPVPSHTSMDPIH